MAEFYAKLVRAGVKTLEQVPIKWREAVRRILEREETGDV